MSLFSRFFIILIFTTFGTTASAAVVINEVQIAPIEGRLIELHNTGDSDVDLTDWYIQRKTATGSSFGSFITKTDLENKTIKANGYFLISHSQLSNSDIVKSLTLTEGNTLRMRNSNGEDVDEIQWGTIEEGKSYQKKASGEWAVALPTPGVSNNMDFGTNASSTQESSAENSTPSIPATNIGSSFPVEPQIFTSAGAHTRTAVVGGDITFSGSVWGLKKEPIENARMFWNFGDGGTAEGKSVIHTYKYPGTYIVVLDAASGFYSATDRVSVEVAPANISISGVGEAASFFVELYNESSLELDISGWSIRTSSQVFIFPQNTLIAPGKKVRFSPDTTGFNSYTTSISLHYPNGSPATTYEPKKISSTTNPSSTTPQKKIVPSGTAAALKTKNENSQTSKEVDNQPNTVAEGKSFLDTAPENQTASLPQATKNMNILWWLAGVSFLALMGVAATILIAKKSPLELVTEEADAYTIVEDKEDEKIPF